MADGWKSEADRHRYLELYRELRGERGFASSERDVETTLGTTRVFEWGGGGEPIVFLHGAGTNSLMWAPVIAALSGRRMVAFDTPGEPGESVRRTPVDRADTLVTWVGEALDATGVVSCQLAGASYGGWLAVHAAAARPERFTSVTLVEPALDQVTMGRFMVHGIASGLAMSIPGPQRKPLAKALHVLELATDPKMRTFGVMGFRRFDRRAMPRPSRVPDAALAGLTMPTALLLASASSIHNPRDVAKRVAAANPAIAIEIVERAGHTLPYEYPELVASTIRAHGNRR